MATAEEYAAWIVKNKDKKGTPDFETVSKAYQEAKSQETPSGKKTLDARSQELEKGFFQSVNKVLEIPEKIGEAAGDWTFEKTGSPLAATAADVAGQVLTPIGAERGLAIGGKALETAASKFIPEASRVRELSARALERMGFKVEPGQVAAVEPEPSAGFTSQTKNANQKLANQKFSEDTGRISETVNDKFLEERFNTLGAKYDQLYQGREFKIPRETINELDQIRATEASLGPAAARTASNVARAITDAWSDLVVNAKGAENTFSINGEGVQRLRTKLQQVGRSSTDPAERREAWRVIGLLDDAIEKSNPTVAKALKIVNRQYRATSALENATKAGKIDAGDVSPSGMGDYFRLHEFHGTTGQQELGNHANQIGLLARWEKSPSMQTPGAGTFWSNLKRVASSAVRTQKARAIQKKIAGKMYNKRPESLSTKDTQELQSLMDQLKEAESSAPAPIVEAGDIGLPPAGFESTLPVQK